MLRRYAIASFWSAHAQNWVQRELSKSRRLWTTLGLFVAIVVHSLVLKAAQHLQPLFATEAAFSALKNVCLGLGGALIGGTAIASSFILFALQVNVERMSAGLFRRLSMDRRLLATFGVAFAISILLASASMVQPKAWAATIALLSVEICVAMPLLYLYAYWRALRLISPTEQLEIVVADATRDLSKWSWRADLARYVLPKGDAVPPGPGDTVHDTQRITYFTLNPNWDATVKKAIGNVTLYARAYAERGDHEVSFAALRALVAINAAYIKTKGRTFFASALLIENPLVTDGVINETLEALRQTMKIALNRGDERQATQTLGAFDFLLHQYLRIEYPGAAPSRTHALLAAGYLSSAVESAVSHKATDVLMEGIRLQGRAAMAFIKAGAPEDCVTLIDKIGLVGAVGVAATEFRPVLGTAAQQLTNITLQLMLAGEYNVRFGFEHIQQSLSLLTTLLLQTPDTPFVSGHSAHLGPYFSHQPSALQSQLVALVNTLNAEGVDPMWVSKIASHLIDWSEHPQIRYKDLMLLAVEKRSGLTFDLLHWIAVIIEVLMAASQAHGLDAAVSERLRTRALHFTYVYSWLPTDREAAIHIEASQHTKTLFEIAWKARGRGCDEVADAARDLLLKWGVRAGAHQTGWGLLGSAVKALAAFSLLDDGLEVWLAGALQRALGEANAPSQEVRDTAARALRDIADRFINAEFTFDPVEHVLAQVEFARRQQYLHRLADILAPPAQAH